MRIWCDVYNSSDVKQGTVYTIINPTITKALDDICTLNFSAPATDPVALALLTNENHIRVYIEQGDDPARELGRGIIRKKTASRNGNGSYTLNFECVGSMDALNRKNVLLGRAYTNQTISTIAASLVELVSGWSVGVDSGLGNQTSRYDGVSVFKALLRTATEKGLHIREGVLPNTVELGAFGDDSGVLAIAPGHNSDELAGNNAIVLIESIVQETDSRDVINWFIPIGAGEGSAAQTLKLATATSYPVNSIAAPDGSLLYYLSDTSSITVYGQIEKIVTFKEIGPVSNSDLAKTYAANALYDAGVAWLLRNKDPLITYRLTVRKPRQVLRPGQMITLTYKGYVETDNSSYELVPIDVTNQQFWIMKTTERITESGDALDLVISSIDRYKQDMTKIVVDAIESMQARNVSVQTFPIAYESSSQDTIQYGASPYFQKPARAWLNIDNKITDIISVALRFRTHPLVATTTFDHETGAPPTNSYLGSYAFEVRESTNFPRTISLFINSVDVTADLDGPWASSNATAYVELDITNYIVNASGGIYQTHTIEFRCAEFTGQDFVHIVIGATSTVNISHGVIQTSIIVMGNTRAVVPAPE